jgi:broad specificity phosphatase PhoE
LKLFLIRHAQSVGNAESRLQGQRDYALTPEGERQADAVAACLRAAGIAAVYASPLTRTMETAERIAAACDLAIVQEPRLVEYDFGDTVSGLTWEVIRSEHPDVIAALMRDDTEFPRYPGEEGRAAFSVRVQAALGEIRNRHKDDPAVAVVTHVGPIVVYLLHVLGRKYSRPAPFAIDNASLTTISCNEPATFADVVVTGINDRCHLDPPTKS